MSEIEANSRYADVLERVAYNAVLSGLSREGTRYFYVNPLEVVPEVRAARMDLEHVAPARVEWLGWACRLNGEALDLSLSPDGYLHIRRPWSASDHLSLEFPMALRFVRADSRIRDAAGRLAMQRGPLVLCAEGLDNGEGLHELVIDPRQVGREIAIPELGEEAVAVEVEGYREGEIGRGDSGLAPQT
jgi:DUF1680 family protein